MRGDLSAFQSMSLNRPGVAARSPLSSHGGGDRLSRRDLLLGIGACVAVPGLAQTGQQPKQQTRRLRMLLNTGYSSPQSWLWLAIREGHLERQGIELDLTAGSGAYTTAPRMIDADFDLGYGDVNALIEEVSRRPQQAPRAVFMFFPASPSCVVVAKDGPMRTPRDLLDRKIIGHDSDVALRTFGVLCEQQNLDRRRIRVDTTWSGMRGMVEEVLAGGADGAFGYASTFTGAIATAHPSLLDRVRFINFSQWAPDLYGSALMVSPRLLAREPATVTRVVSAFGNGLRAWLSRPESGLQALGALHPQTDLSAEGARMWATLSNELKHPDTKTIGYGGIDPARFARSVGQIARSSGLARTPQVQEVFTDAYLPLPSQRVKA